MQISQSDEDLWDGCRTWARHGSTSYTDSVTETFPKNRRHAKDCRAYPLFYLGSKEVLLLLMTHAFHLSHQCVILYATRT